MRSDSEGMLWIDEPPIETKAGKIERVRPLAPFPDNGWAPPRDLPNLFHAKVIGLDTETFDPELITHGPGWGRGSGELVGVSLATQDGYKCYLPIRHTVQTDLNLDPETVIRYLSDLLSRPMPKVGANLTYDCGWLSEENIAVGGELYDVSYAEALLYDTAKSYSLNSISSRWLGESKTEEDLYQWAARSYGGQVNRRQAANIYRCPPSLVGPYAEDDALLPVRILKEQWPQLERHELLNLFKMECALIPVMIGMRKRGLPVSVEKAEAAKEYLQKKEDEAQIELDAFAGFHVEVYAGASISQLFDQKGIKYPRTKKGAPSFRKEWLAAHEHPVAQMVQRVRKYNKARSTFIENAILEKQVDGTIYPSFHPLRGEGGGAVSGRYSSSDPNAQQIPSRDPELGPLIRGVFIPEEGYPYWIKQDLSQIEYRFFAHFSEDQKLIDAYQDPKTDYHSLVSGFLNHVIPRKPVKNLNFGKLYGSGGAKVTKMLRSEIERDQAEEIMLTLTGEIPSGDIFPKLASTFIDIYDEKFPAADASLVRDMVTAEYYGEIRTVMGRRSTFDLWEPINKRGRTPLPYAKAKEEYGNHIKRAMCFRALNRRLQGSSADLLKKGMLDAYRAGIFDRIGFPHVTVHDELDNSYHPDLKADFIELARTIENAIPLRVPVIMGNEVGLDWGLVSEDLF